MWKKSDILRIDPETGYVIGVIELRELDSYPPVPEPDGSRSNVLNGIAHEPTSGRLLVTGKLWPTLFQIEPVARRR